MADCREKIIRELEGKLTIGEIEHIFEKIEKKMLSATTVYPKELATEAEIAAYREKLKTMTPDQKWGKAVQEVFDEAVQEKKNDLRIEYLQAAKNDELFNFIRENNKTEKGTIFDTLIKAFGIEEDGHTSAVIKLMVGDLKGRGKHQTLEAKTAGTRAVDISDVYAELDNYMGAIGFNMTEGQALNVVREFSKPGSTGDKAAQKLVEGVTKILNDSRIRKNEYGANIGYLPDHGIPHSWDARETKEWGLTGWERKKLSLPTTSQAEKDALYDRAYESWMTEALKEVNRDKYLDQNGMPLEEEDLAMVLHEINQSITTNGLSEAPGVGKGKAGFAKSMGEHRELHFKDGEAWYRFNKKGGSADVLGIILKTIEKNARDEAILDTFGPQGEQAFEGALAQAMHLDALSGMSPDKIKKAEFRARVIFKELTETNETGNELVANYFRGIRNWTVATKGGAILLSQPNDLATYGVIARTDGLGIGKAIQYAAEGFNPANAMDKKILRMHGVGTLAILGDVSQRFGASSKGTSWSSKAANLTMRFGFVKYWTDSLQQGFERLVGFHIHDAVERGLENVDPYFKSMLERYGIHAKEWNIIKQAEGVDIGGEKIITPTTIKMLGDSKEIRDIAIKVAGMMHEEANTAVVSPGARQLSWAKEGVLSGTKAGEVWRSFLLFKNFSIAMTQKVLPRILGAEGTMGHRAGITAAYAASMMIAGGFSYQLKQMLFGKNPLPMTEDGWPSMKFLVASGMQSGGMGIFGDIFFAPSNRFGGSLASSLGGPVLAGLEDLYRLGPENFWQAARGEETHWKADTIQVLKNWGLGPLNLFYTRAALDHLLFFTLQEAANPGYLRRMRHRAEQDGRSYWWDPQDKLPDEAPSMGAMVGK